LPQDALIRQPGKSSETTQLYVSGKLVGKEIVDIKSFPVPIILSEVKCVHQHCMISQQPKTQEYSSGPDKFAIFFGHCATSKPHHLGIS